MDPIPAVKISDLGLNDPHSANSLRSRFKSNPTGRVFAVIGQWRSSKRYEPTSVWSTQSSEDRARIAFENWKGTLREGARLVEVVDDSPQPQQIAPDAPVVY